MYTYMHTAITTQGSRVVQIHRCSSGSMALSKVAALTGILLSSYGRVMDELVRKQTNGPLINLTVTTDGIEKSDIAIIDKNFHCVFAMFDLFEGHVPCTNQLKEAVRGCDVEKMAS